SYKFFCINYYITEENLEIEEKNVFTATEIAHIKGTYNTPLVNKFIQSNNWISGYFPNYVLCDPKLHDAGCIPANRRSIIQKVMEALIPSRFAEKIDEYLMQKTISHWGKKYYYMDEGERNFRLRSTRNVSKSHPESVHKIIMDSYISRLKKFNLE
ncbi:MAG TPA: hypothetical protein VGK25_11045, partial [Ignavibacteria bacterium]